MKETGSTTIEMIAWLPILLLILAAIIQFSLYFNARNAVQAAAFEAARQASVSNNPERTAKEIASSYAGGTLPGWEEGDRLKTRVKIDGKRRPGATIVVSLRYNTPLFMHGILEKDLDAGLFQVSGRSEMKLEELP